MFLSNLSFLTVAIVALLAVTDVNAFWEDTTNWDADYWIDLGDQYDVGHCGSCPPGTTCEEALGGYGFATCTCESGEIIHAYEIGWKTCTDCGPNGQLIRDGGDYWFWDYCGCQPGYGMVNGHCVAGNPCTLTPCPAGQHCTNGHDGFAICMNGRERKMLRG